MTWYAFDVDLTEVTYTRKTVHVELDLDGTFDNLPFAKKVAKQIAADGAPHDEKLANSIPYQRYTRREHPPETHDAIIDEITEAEIPGAVSTYTLDPQFAVDCPICEAQHDLGDRYDPDKPVKCEECGYEFKII